MVREDKKPRPTPLCRLVGQYQCFGGILSLSSGYKGRQGVVYSSGTLLLASHIITPCHNSENNNINFLRHETIKSYMRFCPLSQLHAHTPAAYSNQISLITSTVREEYKIKLKEKRKVVWTYCNKCLISFVSDGYYSL